MVIISSSIYIYIQYMNISRIHFLQSSTYQKDPFSKLSRKQRRRKLLRFIPGGEKEQMSRMNRVVLLKGKQQMISLLNLPHCKELLVCVCTIQILSRSDTDLVDIAKEMYRPGEMAWEPHYRLAEGSRHNIYYFLRVNN